MHPGFLSFLVSVWYGLCSLFPGNRVDNGVQEYRISGAAQGTSYQVIYYAQAERVTKAEIDHLLNRIDSSLSIYKSYSLISRFNESLTGIEADPLLRAVVKKALKVNKATAGAFDITVQPLVEAWGFGPRRISSSPDSARIRSLLGYVGSDKIRFSGKRLLKAMPQVRIDVNGIAQGYSVDVIAEYLEKKKIKNYLVEIGGEIRVKGRKQPEGRLMAIGIEGPGSETEGFPVQKIIRMERGSVTTSGNYRKYYQSKGKKISHLIDPITGYPLQNEMISVTVWAKDAMTADAYDNAFMGMGLQKALNFADKRKDLELYIIYRKKDSTVADTATAGFYRLMTER